MNIYSMISIVTTVLSFLVFLGIIAWAYSRSRQTAFAEAANAPFAVPDDGDGAGGIGNRAEQRS